MTLGFTQKINGQPNYFIEKIWDGLHFPSARDSFDLYLQNHVEKFEKEWDSEESFNPKLHTIREDAHNRWRAGMDIHFVINNRSANRFQFAPMIKCVCVQSIEIKYTLSSNETPLIYIGVDNKCLDTYNPTSKISSFGLVDTLAVNDGFGSIEDFFAYFNKDFKGKIIHWTNLKY